MRFLFSFDNGHYNWPSISEYTNLLGWLANPFFVHIYIWSTLTGNFNIQNIKNFEYMKTAVKSIW